jgi:Cu/Ag efflux protein CusF
LTLGVAAPVLAQKTAADNFVDGEVKKIDKDTGKITIKHGPIPNLEMPGMTMVFRAKDAADLDKVKVGDSVRFKADKVDGNITITEIKPVS